MYIVHQAGAALGLLEIPVHICLYNLISKVKIKVKLQCVSMRGHFIKTFKNAINSWLSKKSLKWSSPMNTIIQTTMFVLFKKNPNTAPAVCTYTRACLQSLLYSFSNNIVTSMYLTCLLSG